MADQDEDVSKALLSSDTLDTSATNESILPPAGDVEEPPSPANILTRDSTNPRRIRNSRIDLLVGELSPEDAKFRQDLKDLITVIYFRQNLYVISAQQHQAWALKYFETPAIVLTGIAAVTGALSGAMPQLAQVLSPPTLACAMIGQYLMVWVGLKKLELRSEQFRNAGLDYRILATRAENHLRKYGINCKYKQQHHNLTAVADIKAEMEKIESQITFQILESDVAKWISMGMLDASANDQIHGTNSLTPDLQLKEFRENCYKHEDRSIKTLLMGEAKKKGVDPEALKKKAQEQLEEKKNQAMHKFNEEKEKAMAAFHAKKKELMEKLNAKKKELEEKKAAAEKMVGEQKEAAMKKIEEEKAAAQAKMDEVENAQDDPEAMAKLAEDNPEAAAMAEDIAKDPGKREAAMKQIQEIKDARAKIMGGGKEKVVLVTYTALPDSDAPTEVIMASRLLRQIQYRCNLYMLSSVYFKSLDFRMFGVPLILLTVATSTLATVGSIGVYEENPEGAALSAVAIGFFGVVSTSITSFQKAYKYEIKSESFRRVVENKYRPMADALEDKLLAMDPATDWRDEFRRAYEDVAAAQESMEYFPAQSAVGAWIKQGKL